MMGQMLAGTQPALRFWSSRMSFSASAALGIGEVRPDPAFLPEQPAPLAQGRGLARGIHLNGDPYPDTA